jgi:hypothetical protein
MQSFSAVRKIHAKISFMKKVHRNNKQRVTSSLCWSSRPDKPLSLPCCCVEGNKFLLKPCEGQVGARILTLAPLAAPVLVESCLIGHKSILSSHDFDQLRLHQQFMLSFSAVREQQLLWCCCCRDKLQLMSMCMTCKLLIDALENMCLMLFACSVPVATMAKVYIGNLPATIPESIVEQEFERFGRCRVWVARKPPGFGKNLSFQLQSQPATLVQFE